MRYIKTKGQHAWVDTLVWASQNFYLWVNGGWKVGGFEIFPSRDLWTTPNEATEKPSARFLVQPKFLANFWNIALELKMIMESCSSTPNYKTKLLSDFWCDQNFFGKIDFLLKKQRFFMFWGLYKRFEKYFTELHFVKISSSHVWKDKKISKPPKIFLRQPSYSPDSEEHF